jgi:hypothetical protein
MLRDEFLNADKKVQNAFLKFVNKAISSLELRTSLDIMSKEGLQLLEPKTPIQPLPPPQMPMQPGMMPPQGQPGQMPPQPMPMGQPPMGMPPSPMGQPGMPGQPMPQGQPQMGIPSPMNGTPIQNPAAPVMPNPQNPTQLPSF